jgi:hypothetical protein
VDKKEKKVMGQGGFVICELNAVQEVYPEFQYAFKELEEDVIAKCNADWHPRTFGYLTPESSQYGRTTILPPLFDGQDGNQLAHWRQTLTSLTGNQTLLTGTRAGDNIPEDFKVAWIGLAFPNKQINISEIKFYISDKKYGRLDVEELHDYDCPALIFEKGQIINEETFFQLDGYIEPGRGDNLPDNGPGGVADTIYQRIVPLGACYYKQIDRVLGNTGAVI